MLSPMRINRIKVSGFKSFVDPTTLTLPGNLTAIVGPNGCGKSNIIDALIWVMGESSAKHLRGDSMSDVIFNGSNSRKPVGQANVEIIFDNADGTIGGEYAGFGEISINRTVGRDGISTYQINGARCRRKDITNAFLGTGIGARGYSVIEQGTISQVIEANPQDLRAFLEEAAGISKYKERRRETENRMRRADENIARLDDIREELSKQLSHLNRQAKAAERYQSLKAEERRAQARLLAVRWHSLDIERSRSQEIERQRANEVEGQMAVLRGVEAQQAKLHEVQNEATERFNQTQTRFYAESADISRLEQAITHSEDREHSLETDLADARKSVADAKQAKEDGRARLVETNERLAVIEPKLEERKESEVNSSDSVRAAESLMEQWQKNWEIFNTRHSTLAKAEHAAQIRLEHLLEDVTTADTRASHLDEEATRNDTTDLTISLDQLRAELKHEGDHRAQLVTDRNGLRVELSEIRTTVQRFETTLHGSKVRAEELRGRLSSLQALQEVSLGGTHERIEAWCEKQGVVGVNRLTEHVDIVPGWEQAFEAALRIPLNAFCGPALVSRLQGVTRDNLGMERLTFVDTKASTTSPELTSADLLASKVRSSIDLGPLLDGIFIASDETEAKQYVERMARHEVVVLADGTLYGRNWIQFPGTNGSDSILAREKELGELAESIKTNDIEITELRRQCEINQSRLGHLEESENELSDDLERVDREIIERRGGISQSEAEYQRRAARAVDVTRELERLVQESSNNRDLIETIERDRTKAATELSEHERKREDLVGARRMAQEELNASRIRWREERELTHKLELEYESLKLSQTGLQDSIEKNEAQQGQMEVRCKAIESAVSAENTPRVEMRDQLERALSQRMNAEEKLNSERQSISESDGELQKLNLQRAENEQVIAGHQQLLEQVRLDHRALEVRLQELMERFESTGEGFRSISSTLSANDHESNIQEELDRVERRIARLGPINLAAIDEHSKLSERKNYLDAQHEDLAEALATLTAAIRKIDKETRTRFKETFDRVNQGLQSMFPVLFGGGHAYLEMTGDDLLETGVTVMARPPGKRNSTIHLLSGGEKALTALAFVFSIFELSPAPFCLLDEVDAPLDDANIMRLTDMLISMSNSIQFLFVTHNKITMEIAEQLIGVTMKEAGVSRLVSVNMEEAVELAATA